MEPTKVELVCDSGERYEPDGFRVAIGPDMRDPPLIDWYGSPTPPEGGGLVTWWMDEGSRMHMVPVKIKHDAGRVYLEPTDFIRTYIDGEPAGPLTKIVGEV